MIDAAESNHNPTPMKSRRQYLQRVSTMIAAGVSTSLAGCTNIFSEERTPGNEYTRGSISIPNPVIDSTGSPKPKIVGTREFNNDAGNREFEADILNDGLTGEVATSLNWVLSIDSEEKAPDELRKVVETTIEVIGGEVETVGFVADEPDYSKGYWFITTPRVFVVTINNTGGDGNVIVELLDGETVVRERQVTLTAGEQRQLQFEWKSSRGGVEWDIRARPVEQ